MIINLLTIVIAIVAVLLMAAVLVQNPKGGGVDSTFGGTASNQMFGAAKSADYIEKITWYLAVALFILCIVTTIMAGGLSTGAEADIINVPLRTEG